MSRVTILANNVWGQIKDPLDRDVLEYIDSKTKFHPDGYQHTWNYKKGRWDGFNHLFNSKEQAFRIGILDRILKALEFHNIYATVESAGPETKVKSIQTTIPDGVIRPYDFQQKVRQIVHAHKRGIISSPTGTGKTLMVALMIDELKRQALIVLNERVLLDQMHRVMTRCFPSAHIGYIGDQEFELGDITVATVQSLRSILGIIQKNEKVKPSRYRDDLQEWLNTVGVVIHDEAHLADADTCVLLYGMLSNPDHIYGYSATPMEWANKTTVRANMELEQIFGKVIYSTHDIDFIKLGLKVPLVVKCVQVKEEMQTYGTFRDNQAVLYKKALMYEITKNDAWLDAIRTQVAEFNNEGMSCFVYAGHSLEYGQKVADALFCPFIQGKTTRSQRFKAFDALQNKEMLCLVSDIGGVGLDIPSLDAIILASDIIDVRQIRGRVERAWPGKQCGHLVDMWKDCSFLKSHYKTRINQYTADGNLIL